MVSITQRKQITVPDLAQILVGEGSWLLPWLLYKFAWFPQVLHKKTFAFIQHLTMTMTSEDFCCLSFEAQNPSKIEGKLTLTCLPSDAQNPSWKGSFYPNFCPSFRRKFDLLLVRKFVLFSQKIFCSSFFSPKIRPPCFCCAAQISTISPFPKMWRWQNGAELTNVKESI